MDYPIINQDSLLNESALIEVAVDYIPQELLREVNESKIPGDFVEVAGDGEAVLQLLMCNSNHMLRMYGTPQELAANLKIYRNFPLSHKKFLFDVVEPYNTTSYIYKSLKGEQFFYKSDIFHYLQLIVFEMQQGPPHEVPGSMFMALLKSYEERLVGCCDFVKYDTQLITKMASEIAKMVKEVETSTASYELPPISNNFEKVFNYFKKLLPEWKDEEHYELKRIYEKYSMCEKNQLLYAKTYSFIKMLSEVLQKVIGSRPELFLPYSKNDPNALVAVRIFEDGSQRFVMRAELNNAINIRNPNQESLKNNDRDGILSTLTLDEVYKHYGDRIDNIEFIRIPIKRAKHRAVPIMTPTGDYCILAIDALLEVFYKLIICQKVFQRIKSDTWHIAKTCISGLDADFTPYFRDNYFITLDTVKSYKEDGMGFSTEDEHSPLKHVRNAKQDGFTVENLKNELRNLGVTDVFPEIIDYAEGVYEQVDKAKKEKVLRTCDLFDAVEQCQLICIFNRFPNLKLFLHTQKACHRIPNLQCELCEMTIPSTTFQKTVWNEYNYMETISTFRIGDPENKANYELKCPNGVELSPNLIYFTPEEAKTLKINYFILEDQDAERIGQYLIPSKPSRHRVDKRLNILQSLQTYFKIYQKRIFIRAIPSTNRRREETRRVFTDEALEIIPLIMELQNSLVDSNGARIEKYRKKWSNDDENVSNTISLPEFEHLLEEFDINKRLITIVPDPVYELTVPKMLRDSGNLTLNIFNSNGKMSMRSSQAIFHIFQSVVCCVNWKIDYCKQHQNCLEDLMKTVIDTMKEYQQMEQVTYVTVAHVEERIQILKAHCAFKIQKNPSPLIELSKKKFDEMISSDYIQSQFKLFGLVENDQIKPIEEKVTLPLWCAKLRFLWAWINIFNEEANFDILNTITSEILFKSPVPDKCKTTLMEPFKTKLVPVEKKTTSLRKSTKPDVVALKQILYTKLETSKQENSPESPLASEANTKSKVEEKQKTSDDTKKTSMIRETENESKCCSKCLRSSELCNEAKKELKTTQNKLKNYETKAKRTEELEKKMKEKDKEIEQFKDRVSSLSNCIKENEALKLKIAQYDAKETRWKMTERNLIDSNSRILEKVALLEAQLESEKQKIQSLEQEVLHLKETNEMEILEKTRINKELSDTNLRLSVQNEENERTIRHLLDRLSSAPSPSIPTVPTIPIKEESGKYDGMRYQLVRLQKIKDSFRSGKQLKQAKEMVGKLISLTNRPVICPDYELQQFEGKMQNYIQAVEMNIQKLKKTGDPNNLSPLPDYPSFSERFMKEYWSEMKKQSLTSSEITSELADPECLICLSNVESSDETIKCEHCRRRYHSSCATEWLKTKMECPTCRRPLLNPSEYPSLS